MSQEQSHSPHWIASAPGVAHSLGKQHTLFHVFGSEANHLLIPDILSAMAACREFRPYEQQVQAIARALPGLAGQEDAIRQTLDQLIEQGLFIRSADWRPCPETAPQESAFAERPALIVRSCDRPALVERLLTSALAYEENTGRRLRWLVLDDSNSLDKARATEQVVDKLAGQGLAAHFLGRSWQEEFVADLIEQTGAPAELVNWLLLGEGAGPMTAGRNFNIALLLTAGEGFCALDDDFRLDATQPPDTSLTPRLDQSAPKIVHFLDDTSEAAYNFGTPIADPLAAHLDVCGQPLGAVLGGPHVGAWRDDSVRGCELENWQKLGPDSRVIGTVYGTRGSPAALSGHWLQRLDDPASFSRLVGNPEGYARRAAGQWLVRAARQPTIVRATPSSPLTLDNRQMLPCTVPSGRGEDAVLGHAIAAIYPQHVVLDYPDAWLHERENRHGRGDTNQEVLKLSLNNAIVTRLASTRDQMLSRSPDERLAGIANAMADLATAPEATRFDFYREIVQKRRAHYVDQLNERIDAFQGPADHPWLAHAQQLVRANSRAMAEGDTTHIDGRADVNSRQELTDDMAEQLGRYAQALRIWPRLWQHCHQHKPRL